MIKLVLIALLICYLSGINCIKLRSQNRIKTDGNKMVAIHNSNCLRLVPEINCLCNDFVINCTQSNFTNSDIFLSLTDQNWPKLDTLIMTGNKFDDLDLHLFGMANKHKNLRYLDLSNNGIKRIHINALMDLPNLEHLILSDNKISVTDTDERSYQFFHHLSRLQILELEDAFDKTASAKQLANAVQYVLGPLNGLDMLGYLHLRNNSIEYLNPSTFCNLPALQYLYLENNRLQTLSGSLFNEKCTPSLYELALDNNSLSRFSRFEPDWLDSDVHLNRISFAGNPFECFCELNPFVSWFNRNLNRMVRVAGAKCAPNKAEPKRFENKPLSEIGDGALRCASDDASAHVHRVYVVCGLAIAGMVTLLTCLAYTNGGRSLKQCAKIIGAKTTDRMRVTCKGYQILGREPEVKAEMV